MAGAGTKGVERRFLVYDARDSGAKKEGWRGGEGLVINDL